jgi:hypothetical protein
VAEVAVQPDGSAQVTVTASDTAALKAMAGVHLPFLERLSHWLGAEMAPELGEAAAFLKVLAASPPEGSTLTVNAPQKQALQGLLNAHVPDFQAVLAVVESPAVRSLLSLAEALL